MPPTPGLEAKNKDSACLIRLMHETIADVVVNGSLGLEFGGS